MLNWQVCRLDFTWSKFLLDFLLLLMYFYIKSIQNSGNKDVDMWITFVKDFLKADVCCLLAILRVVGMMLFSCGKVLLWMANFGDKNYPQKH